MKLLTVLCLSTVALAAQAAPTGTAELVIYPDYDSGYYSTDLRQEGNKILGQTSLGNNNLVNLQINEGKYEGSTGNGLTSLKCSATNCSGFISGGSADFTINESGFKGTVDSNLANLTRKNGDITINTIRGYMNLHMTSVGNYDGTGSFGNDINSQFHATLKTTGTLANLSDNALSAIFLVEPLSRDGN